MDTREITVATWNAQWARGSSPRGMLVAARLREVAADLLVVTEGSRDLLPPGGHVIDAGADWGYESPPYRRKTMLWSRWPLTGVTPIGDGAGKGRVVMAEAESAIGPIRIVAVCIPWASAHVSTGRRDASNWSEHLECCDQIEKMASGFDPRVPTVIAGDFNQRVPRGRQPIRVAQRLADVLGPWAIHTAGEIEHGPLIDHIASDLTCSAVQAWSGRDDGGRLSDHAGVLARLRSGDIRPDLAPGGEILDTRG
ncbi:endonuclease/exonuclease/phosphatase family protein [Rhodococcus sp. UNC363MFTsu5.1]|uniref:endonuclease/exonuclease/phosphatase family protein n=1 Tax=Rhodococcus sp. UNC363MFTsu5.1 TaxID=1449069 RepID=UPI0006913F7F|nr:endonuclease/exonuclease/phosphatase family protein [Rhodococcus sp. UNC363MFTsu5.1]